jgi:hypothetical protein
MGLTDMSEHTRTADPVGAIASRAVCAAAAQTILKLQISLARSFCMARVSQGSVMQ